MERLPGSRKLPTPSPGTKPWTGAHVGLRAIARTFPIASSPPPGAGYTHDVSDQVNQADTRLEGSLIGACAGEVGHQT